MSPRASRVGVEPLSPGCWRLWDESVPGDGSSVVAYIERDGDGFDVVWVGCASGREWYGSLEGAVAVAESLLATGDTRGARRPVHIPHRAPSHA